MNGPTNRHGTVTGFDESRGFGEISTDDGSRVFFHATQLRDGTRTIPVGAVVEFELRPGGRGRYEAIGLTRVDRDGGEGSFRCPVCNATMVGQARTYEICDQCGWEDDPAQFDDPTSTGANRESLNQARVAWKQRERDSPRDPAPSDHDM